MDENGRRRRKAVFGDKENEDDKEEDGEDDEVISDDGELSDEDDDDDERDNDDENDGDGSDIDDAVEESDEEDEFNEEEDDEIVLKLNSKHARRELLLKKQTASEKGTENGREGDESQEDSEEEDEGEQEKDEEEEEEEHNGRESEEEYNINTNDNSMNDSESDSIVDFPSLKRKRKLDVTEKGNQDHGVKKKLKNETGSVKQNAVKGVKADKKNKEQTERTGDKPSLIDSNVESGSILEISNDKESGEDSDGDVNVVSYGDSGEDASEDSGSEMEEGIVYMYQFKI